MVIHIASLLDKAIVAHRLSSDYKLALVLGVSHSSLTNYRTGKTLPDTRIISLLCDLTGDDPALLAAQIEAERAKTPEARAVWQQVASRLAQTARETVAAGVFSVTMLGALLAGSPMDASAKVRPSAERSGIYIVESITVSENPPSVPPGKPEWTA